MTSEAAHPTEPVDAWRRRALVQIRELARTTERGFVEGALGEGCQRLAELARVHGDRELSAAASALVLAMTRLSYTADDPSREVQERRRRTLDDIGVRLSALADRLAGLDLPAPPFLAPEPVAAWIPRDALVEEARRLLASPVARSPLGVAAVAFSGPAGAGKSQLALECARRWRDRYPRGVYWIWPADGWEERVLQTAIQAGGVVCDGVDTDVRKEDARRWLRELTHALVVLDDVQSVEQVRRLFPNGASCHLLISTRAELPVPTVPVPALEEAHPAPRPAPEAGRPTGRPGWLVLAAGLLVAAAAALAVLG